MNLTVESLDKINWSFDRDPQLRISSRHYRSVPVDPTPCYTHDLKLVKNEVAKLENLFDIPTVFYVAAFECISRTNGFADSQPDYDGNYDKEQGRYTDKVYWVFLSGKRTPIHPAMTRYLVSHEYGHIVEYWLEHNWGAKELSLKQLYKKVRKLPDQPGYGPGTWHLSPGELFANDFRITLAKEETEYWPHPEVERTPPALEEWWRRVHKDPSKERLDELYELNETAE